MSQWAPWEVPRKPTRQRGRSGHGAAACCLRPPRERASARLSARPCPAPHCLLGSRQCPGPTAPPGPSGLGSRREEGVGAWGLGEEERGSREVFLSSTNRRQCCSVFSLPALPADPASAPAGGSLCGPLARAPAHTPVRAPSSPTASCPPACAAGAHTSPARLRQQDLMGRRALPAARQLAESHRPLLLWQAPSLLCLSRK